MIEPEEKLADPQAEVRRSGLVGLAGVPNAGKSTLVNRILGRKISIVSSCPQTTRHRICGIWTDAPAQAVLVDLPGILETGDKFNGSLVSCAGESLNGCDFVLHVRTTRSAGSPDEEQVGRLLQKIRKPVWQVWNKIDVAPPVPTESKHGLDYARSFAVSAKTGRGIERLKAALKEALPEGPWLYPPEDLSDRDMRFLAAERVREKLFLYLQKELPYGIATWTETWENREGAKPLVRVVIQTERESHKRIIIGKGAEMLKKIGSAARREIEDLYGEGIFLELFVRVKPNWRKDEDELSRLELTGGDRC